MIRSTCGSQLVENAKGALAKHTDHSGPFNGPLGPLVWPGIWLLSLLQRHPGIFLRVTVPLSPSRVSGISTSVLLSAALKCVNISITVKWALHP